MRFIAKKIDEVIMNNNDEEKLKRIREEVKDFCKGFSIPGLLLSDRFSDNKLHKARGRNPSKAY
ncbi:MAG: hypothetical protein HY999_04880 [Nitrospinae bacterium]|nr:hypothetical protein [Nitrospinota bacterium]